MSRLLLVLSLVFSSIIHANELDLYIVTMKNQQGVRASSPHKYQAKKDKVSRLLNKTHQNVNQNFKLKHVYKHALNGFSVSLTKKMAKKLQNDPDVSVVELDTGAQAQLAWGLDRIDQVKYPLDNVYNYKVEYTGSNVHVYVLDTGIRSTHSDFLGRVVDSYDAITNTTGSSIDYNGHGTHVAGTIAGQQYGVAKNTILHNVRVLNSAGYGSWAEIIRGIDWVIEQHIARNNARLSYDVTSPSIINMSISGNRSSSLDNAVKNAVNTGIITVVAAGNDSGNSCDYSPAHLNEVITVGASTDRDYKASFSNRGSCMDIYAPGEDIISASHQNDYWSITMSGTSMAAPHVSGAAAIYLSFRPNATQVEVQKALKTNNVASIKLSNSSFETTDLLHNFYLRKLQYDKDILPANVLYTYTSGTTTTLEVWADPYYSDPDINLQAFCARNGYMRATGSTTSCGEDEAYYANWSETEKKWVRQRSGSTNKCYPIFSTITCEK